jgi:hypothetical protein
VQGEIDEDVLRRGAAQIRDRLAETDNPLGQLTQSAIEELIVNWVKIHPDDVCLPPYDIFIKYLQSKLHEFDD